MTAEVVIMNKAAIAVAADSAVTVGKTKVHRTANKIFAICDKEPIGAMIYGADEFCGVPWETLMKLFRSEHRRSYSTVEQCTSDLREFVAKPIFRNEEACIKSLACFALDVVEMVKNRLGDMPTKNKKEAVDRAIDEESESYAAFDQPINFDTPTLPKLRAEAGNVIDTVAQSIFDDLNYKLTKSHRTKLVTLVHTALGSSYRSVYASGVALFGYGNEQLFPSLVHQTYDAAPLGAVRGSVSTVDNFEDTGAFIYPFADRDIMDILIQGISNHLRDLAVEVVRDIGQEIADRVIKDNLTLSEDEYAVAKAINERAIKAIVDEFEENWVGYIRNRYVIKMVDTIEHMSKEDLAVVAEALVDVTALRMRTSDVLESVSGPVDVCVVSKGDGLIWIKRKNYFELASNVQYLYRRFGGLGPFAGGASEKDH